MWPSLRNCVWSNTWAGAERCSEPGAIDYLLKPIRPAGLAGTVQRLRDRTAAAGGDPSVSQRRMLHRIQATIGNTLRFFSVDDIYYCRTDSKYTRIVTDDSNALIRRSLTGLLDHLDPDRFWRIHRGIVV